MFSNPNPQPPDSAPHRDRENVVARKIVGNLGFRWLLARRLRQEAEEEGWTTTSGSLRLVEYEARNAFEVSRRLLYTGQTEAHWEESGETLAEYFDSAWEKHHTEVSPERMADLNFALSVLNAREE